jgi:hypothetical protein
VAGGAFRDRSLADGIAELALHGRFVQVVTGDPSCARMRAEGGPASLRYAGASSGFGGLWWGKLRLRWTVVGQAPVKSGVLRMRALNGF